MTDLEGRAFVHATLAAENARLRADRDRYREALERIDPSKLEILAQWLDDEQDRGRWGTDREVQDELRDWAEAIRAPNETQEQER